MISGILTIWVIYAAGARLISRRAGLLAAFLLAVNPLHIHYSREARNYSLLMLLVTASLPFAASLYRQPRLRDGVFAAMLFILLLYTHNISMFFLLPVLLLLLATLIQSFDRRRLVVLFTTICLTFLGYLPWLPHFLSQSIRITQTSVSGSGPVEWVKPYWKALFPFQVPWSLGVLSHGAIPPYQNFTFDLPWTAWAALAGSLFLIVLGWKNKIVRCDVKPNRSHY